MYQVLLFKSRRHLCKGSIGPIALIWVSLERSFPPAEVEHRRCQFWSKLMTSKIEERPRLVTAGYGRHKSHWVKETMAQYYNYFF